MSCASVHHNSREWDAADIAKLEEGAQHPEAGHRGSEHKLHFLDDPSATETVFDPKYTDDCT